MEQLTFKAESNHISIEDFRKQMVYEYEKKKCFL